MKISEKCALAHPASGKRRAAIRGEKFMSGKRKYLFLLIAIILIAYLFIYQFFASSNTYKESRDHLLEIYNQMDRSYSMMTSYNWNMLKDWGGYIHSLVQQEDGEKLVRDFIQKEKGIYQFSGFYFLDENGCYITESGEQGTLSGIRMPKDRDDLKNADFMGHVHVNETSEVLFAVMTDAGTYRDFSYTGIGICYTNEYVNERVDVSAFHENSECYLIYPDGKIMFSTDDRRMHIDNLVSFLIENGEFKGITAEEFQQNIRENKIEIEEYEIGGVAYYIACRPISFKEGMILGMVPSETVDSNVIEIRRVSAAVVAVTFTAIMVGALLYILSWSREQFKEKDKEIYHRDKLFRVLTDRTNDMYILFSSKDYKARYVSANIERVLSIPKEQIEDDVRNLVTLAMDDKVTLTDEVLANIEVDTYWETLRSMRYQKTGEQRLYKQILYHISDYGDSDYIMQLSDRTREHHITEQLEQALQEAERANQAKSAFLFNMSHDLRTPMNAIVGIATLLSKETANPDKVKGYAEKILMSSNVLFGLINDILDMSKIENGKITLLNEAFSIPELLEGIVTIMLPQAQEKEQQFTVCVENVREEVFVGDRVRLQQVLLNILSNAVKYTQQKGSIFLSVAVLDCQEESQLIRFIVQDNGMGMTQEFQKSIFEPFARMDENSGKIQGTGLGMAIVKNLVDLMDGTISVESRLEKGSTFTVDLRLKVQKQQENTEFWKDYCIFRMLLIDDEKEVCRNIQSVMNNTGVVVDYTTDAGKAASLVQSAALEGRPYDLVITDYEMPETDGIETIRSIREGAKCPMPILLLMDLNWNELEKEAHSAGVDGFLFKPFFISTLQKRIMDIRGTGCMAHGEEVEAEVSQNESIKGIHFLVVEDYEINREILEELLSMEGATCESAVNGAEGVEMFETSQAGHFDMILMDVQMPVMNGYEASMKIRAGSHPQSSTIPIIAMTANAFEEDVAKALQSGMNAHVAKPVDMKIFIETVNRFKDRSVDKKDRRR